MTCLRRASLAACALLAATAVVAQPPRRTRAVRVTGETVVAFFPAVTQATVDRGGDLVEVLDDFQYHTGGARRALSPRGIRVVEVYADTLRVTVANRVRVFVPPRDSTVGYYFVAPGREPLVLYGVMTDTDITEAALTVFKHAPRVNVVPRPRSDESLRLTSPRTAPAASTSPALRLRR